LTLDRLDVQFCKLIVDPLPTLFGRFQIGCPSLSVNESLSFSLSSQLINGCNLSNHSPIPLLVCLDSRHHHSLSRVFFEKDRSPRTVKTRAQTLAAILPVFMSANWEDLFFTQVQAVLFNSSCHKSTHCPAVAFPPFHLQPFPCDMLGVSGEPFFFLAPVLPRRLLHRRNYPQAPLSFMTKYFFFFCGSPPRCFSSSSPFLWRTHKIHVLLVASFLVRVLPLPSFSYTLLPSLFDSVLSMSRFHLAIEPHYALALPPPPFPSPWGRGRRRFFPHVFSPFF